MRKLFPGSRREFLFLCLILVLLLLRAWQLRLPEVLENLNEDEYHHNYWLIHNQSVYGIFTIWGIKALLDHLVRLYFWFPMFSLGWPVFLFLSIIIIAVVLSVKWVQNGRARMKSTGERRLIQLFALAFTAGTLACMLWLWTLPHSGSLVFGLPLSRLLQQAFLLALLGFSVWITVLCLKDNDFTSSWVDKLRNQKFAWPVAFVSAAGFFITSLLLILPLYGIEMLSPGLVPFYLRLIPIIVLVEYAAYITLGLILLIQPNSPTKNALLVALLLVLGLILALAIKPGGANRNYTELMLLAPSFIYSLISVCLSFLLSYSIFRASSDSRGLAVAFAALVAIWVVYHPSDMAMAGFARMYVFASLLSLAWFFYYVFVGKTDSFTFFLLSFLFANSHFFAVPIVIAAYSWDAWKAIRKSGWQNGRGLVLQGSAILLSVLLINLPIIPYLFQLAESTRAFDLGVFISESVQIAWGYLKYLSASIGARSHWLGQWYWVSATTRFLREISPILIILYLITLFVRRKHEPEGKLLYLGLLILPLCFIFFGTRAEGGIVRSSFSLRYYTPFLGFGFVLGILFLLQVRRTFRYLSRPHSKWRGFSVAAALIGGLIFLLVALDIVLGIADDQEQLTVPPANWTDYYLGYSELKNAGRPLLLLSTTPISIQLDIPLFYLEYSEGGFEEYYEIYGSTIDSDFAESRIGHFIRKYPDGIIVLDWLLADCPQSTPETGDWGASVERVHSGQACIWKIPNASDFREVCQIAQAFSFPATWSQSPCIR